MNYLNIILLVGDFLEIMFSETPPQQQPAIQNQITKKSLPDSDREVSNLCQVLSTILVKHMKMT